MKASEEHSVAVDAGDRALSLRLRRFPPAHPGSPQAHEHGAVLMLHGGNTLSDTFLLPGGGITAYLTERDFDVWLVDWRTSPHIVDP
jgi:pimeloyl-ACP methyl ester carboxylesterase